MNRRTFLRNSVTSALGLSVTTVLSEIAPAQSPVRPVGPAKLKTSCNLFSFNNLLLKGQMSLEEVIEFCARLGFDAVDPTGYYFPGYPETPPDDFVYRIKRQAFVLGLDISGTGVRNDFTDPDASRRNADVEMTKRWIEVAARLGAPVIRVFAGRGVPEGHSEPEVSDWIIDGVRRCAEHARNYGVMVGLQNHNDFVKRSGQLLRILKGVNSEWFGVDLDIGSFHTGDSYEEIKQLLPYTITCQIKENMFVQGEEVKTDLARIFRLFKDSGYRGYIPLETLGAGDPRQKIPAFLDEVRKALA
jgi:sugar phosphate isomerase/epimerase